MFSAELRKPICMKKVVAYIDIDDIGNLESLSMKNAGILK